MRATVALQPARTAAANLRRNTARRESEPFLCIDLRSADRSGLYILSIISLHNGLVVLVMGPGSISWMIVPFA
jgi:hypothetical protein